MRLHRLHAHDHAGEQAELVVEAFGLALGGKVYRYNRDGSIPGDNPFGGSPTYAFGLRNPFGLAVDPETGDVWVTENGPSSFDEINHAAFLFSTFFPDSLYIPVMRAYSAVSQMVAPHVNVDGPEVTDMIRLLRERGTAIDGTWNLWLSSRGAAASASLGIPYSGTEDLARRSDVNYMRMLKRLFDAGVPILPGTDGSSYNVELELYERAGIPPASVLQIATIVPARVMKDDRAAVLMVSVSE